MDELWITLIVTFIASPIIRYVVKYLSKSANQKQVDKFGQYLKHLEEMARQEVPFHDRLYFLLSKGAKKDYAEKLIAQAEENITKEKSAKKN